MLKMIDYANLPEVRKVIAALIDIKDNSKYLSYCVTCNSNDHLQSRMIFIVNYPHLIRLHPLDN